MCSPSVRTWERARLDLHKFSKGTSQPLDIHEKFLNILQSSCKACFYDLCNINVYIYVYMWCIYTYIRMLVCIYFL